MTTEITNHSNLDFERFIWRKQLHHWKDEIKLFFIKLQELLKRCTDKWVLNKLHEFQDSFKTQENHFKKIEVKSEILTKNNEDTYRENEKVIDMSEYLKHKKIRNLMETQRSIFNDLKQQFFLFLSKFRYQKQ